MQVSLVTIGSEILDGRIQDTNSQWITEILSDNGIKIERIVSCQDSIEDIKAVLKFIASSNDPQTIICTGGLGPTEDDITRQAIAKYLKVDLVKNSDSYNRLLDLFHKRGRTISASNEIQSFFPNGSEIILNKVGTAEGFYISGKNVTVFALPGVPREMKPMFSDNVLEFVATKEAANQINKVGFRTFGVPESIVGERVKEVLKNITNISVSYRATAPEVQVILKSSQLNEAELDTYKDEAIKSIGKTYCFTDNPNEILPETLHNLLLNTTITISFAESCTGGLASSLMTKLPGSSKYFTGSVVAYSNKLKSQLLGVSEELILTQGAVSEQVAREMASGIRQRTGSDIGVSVTGIAGPDGGSEEKPVGTFFVGLASNEGNKAYKFFYPLEREWMQRYSAFAVIDVVRRTVLGVEVPEYFGARILS